MPQPLDYRQPEKGPDEGFNWRDVRPTIVFQFASLVICLILPHFLIFVLPAVLIYWVVTAIISARGIRPSVYGWDQVFVRWGYPATFVVLLAGFVVLTFFVRW